MQANFPCGGPDAMTPSADRLAADVRAFYEDHPYPPPIDSLDRRREASHELSRHRSDFHLLWPSKPFRDDFRILVAGCGTSQAARYASRWPRARVTGIDVSQTSIRATEALQRRHGLGNLDVRQLQVEHAAELDNRFDLIVCTGVLHHLPDPDAGLRALRDVLEPDGALHLMVYAPYGRAGVYLLQDYARRLGIGTSLREIGDLAASLRRLPPDHPLVPLLRKSPDFGSAAGIADALLHPRDRPFTVPQLLDFLGCGGLRFGRWLRQAPYVPSCGVLAASPHALLLQKLTPQEQHAAAELFRGTMARHSVVASRGDGPGDADPIRFDGDAWLDYVPIRLPGTISVQQGLPAGAACVLINQGHTCTDLILPLDPTAKELFDVIDGVRTIRELANGSSEIDSVRRLFQQLWSYDQVVFAAVPARPAAPPEGDISAFGVELTLSPVTQLADATNDPS